MRVVLLAVAVLLLAGSTFGQQLTATLSGGTCDRAGAVVPNARVELINEASGDIRRTEANVTGNFTLTAIPPGSYRVKVTVSGFAQWVLKGVVLNQGDARTVGNVTLKLGTATKQVDVSASGEQRTGVVQDGHSVFRVDSPGLDRPSGSGPGGRGVHGHRCRLARLPQLLLPGRPRPVGPLQNRRGWRQDLRSATEVPASRRRGPDAGVARPDAGPAP